MKNKHKNKMNEYRNRKCIISGKLTQNHEVVIAEYAVLYVKKLGFLVIPSFFQDTKQLIKLDKQLSQQLNELKNEGH